MKRIPCAFFALLCLVSSLNARNIEVKRFRYSGPFPVRTPYMVDSVSVDGKSFDIKSLLKTNISYDVLESAALVETAPHSDADALHLIGFRLQTSGFSKANIKIGGLKDYVLTVNGKESGCRNIKFEPGTYNIALKYLGKADCADSLSLLVEELSGAEISLVEDSSSIYSLDLNTIGVSCAGASLSAGGKYCSVGRSVTLPDGKRSSSWDIFSTKDGSLVLRTDKYISWMPYGDSYWYTVRDIDGKKLVSADPQTGAETIIARSVPEGSFVISPAGDCLIYSLEKEGPKEGDVHQILVPDDRQPGWRNRSYLARYDLASGMMQPLTFGYHNSWLSDISRDGSKILFMTSRDRLTKRPTTLYSIYEMNLRTMEVSCLVEDDGFIRSAVYSPNAGRIAVSGPAEAFDGIGKRVLEGQIPNGYDVQLFMLDIASGKKTALTADFNPSVSDYRWSAADGLIYALCEDKDCLNLYTIDTETLKATKINCQEDRISSFDLSENSKAMVYYGQSLENGDRAYLVDLKKGKSDILADFSAERLENVVLGKGGAYEFTSRNGDLINGFYVLPPDFDPAKKYPLLVHYYGGCSPSDRYCIGSYSPQYYAAQGYVFYVINPSGAAGFGQEFAARHVNTAGDVVADDILEGTRRFCEDHPFVDSSKVGCFSASYGGFMTQLLLSKSDIYAAGISHAGISDHTSYWGEGYWGYSYSEISMADSYPWTRKDLYVDRSPLYNADKIHTPLLFLHGSADTNVPIGESIQMFTALKLLGEDTAFVVVDGENHGIREFSKRRQWLRTISAWFAKYLKDDSTWWDELYPQKNL